MKKTLLVAGLLSAVFSAAQNTGVNTTDPTHTLDVNGKLRVREMDEVTNVAYLLGATANGELKKLQFYKYLIDSGVKAVTTPVDIEVAKDANLIQQPDLGMTKSVTVPAGKRYAVGFIYNIPVGTVQEQTTPSPTYTLGNGTLFQSNFHGLFGATFTKNGQIMPQASRKLAFRPAYGGYVQPENVSGFYTEVIDNRKGSAAVTNNYAITGMIYHVPDPTTDGSGATVRFNAGGNIYHPEYNWEYSAMTFVVIEVPN